MAAIFLLLLCLAILSALGAMLLASIGWSMVLDYGSLLRRPQPPAGPDDWSVLEAGRLPPSSPHETARLKQRLARSCEVHTLTERCTVTSLSDVQQVCPTILP